ncbi:MAG: PAS domain S-box protein [Myxococcales bacterium]|jgi:PAS domain S-box-containing protein|nr:PAS domain S-box protein [Myxococcales bacterium]HRC57249.1 histidine kinase dimerization/phospho-acceptor domain-containing protein [Kofleriaceae bacterium]
MSAEPSFLDPLLGALHCADLGIAIIGEQDGDLQRPYFNEACASMLGYSRDEFAALPVLASIAPEQLETIVELQHRIRDGANAPLHFETTLKHRDGNRVPVEVVSHPLAMERGVAHVFLVRNLLPRQRVQLSLLEADRIALVSALAAGVAHEVKNPLTGMLLALRMLRRTLATELPEPTRSAALRALDDSLSGGERIAGNMQDLLSLASTSSEQRELDLGQVTSAALRLVSPILEDRARVVRELHPVPMVLGDEARLGQAVLAMLLFSGSGFHGDDPRDNRILVCVEAADSAVEIEISDNGGALCARDMARAFDPFFVSRGRGAGLGVGLSVARSIAMAHGGSVEMEPFGTVGITTRMRLPRAGLPVREDAAAAQSPPP